MSDKGKLRRGKKWHELLKRGNAQDKARMAAGLNRSLSALSDIAHYVKTLAPKPKPKVEVKPKPKAKPKEKK